MDAAHGRLATLRNHVTEDASQSVGLNACSAASSDAADVQYSVALPEKLSPDGPWVVHRCGYLAT